MQPQELADPYDRDAEHGQKHEQDGAGGRGEQPVTRSSAAGHVGGHIRGPRALRAQARRACGCLPGNCHEISVGRKAKEGITAR